MDSLDDPENTAKVSDSAYSTSCSNSQSRRSESSKSTHSSSHSSGSSGYCGKPASSGSNKLRQPSEKRSKGKDGKKKSKLTHMEVHVESATEGEARPQDLEEKSETGHQKIKRKYAAISARAQSAPPGPAVDKIDMNWNSDNGKEALVTSSTANNQPFNCSDPQHMANHNRGFSCVISMHDGVVVCTTSTITCTLGFPKDMWVGRAFIDFVHPKDRQTFASQIVSGVIIPKDMMCESPPAKKPAGMVDQTMYCRIRTHSNLGSGFCVKKGTITFLPFVVNLTFKDVSDEEGKKAYLLVQTTLLSSAYKIPFEPVTERTPFTIRHIANGRVQYIDRAVVPFLGYLPQDICDQDMLMLYHPDDLAQLLQVYDTVLEKGCATKSQVYRMQAQNGDYVKLETEFSSFVNPCSKKLEFIDGKHCVVQGPDNPDVFQTPTGTPDKLPEEEKYKAQMRRDTILKAMNETTRKHSEAGELVTSRRCMELANLMESFFQEPSRAGDELRLEIQEQDISCFERDSVMLGGISPHHENESESGTETPLSYNTLNYYETLQRYFDSYPQAIGGNRTDRSDQAKTKKPAECSASIKDKEFEKMSAKNYQLRRLTEGELIKHNTIMKKNLIKKQREQCPPGGGNRRQATKGSRPKKRKHMGRFSTPFQPPPAQGIPETASHEAKRPSWQYDVGPARKQHCSWAERARTPVPSAPLFTKTTQSYVNTIAAGVPHVMYAQSLFGAPFVWPHGGRVPPALAPCVRQPVRDLPPLVDEHYEQQSRVQSRVTISASNSGLDSSDQTGQTESDESRERNCNPTSTATVPSEGHYKILKDAKASARKKSDKRNDFTSAEKTDGESSFSSFSSSFFKTDSGSNEESDSKNKHSDKAWPDKAGVDKPEPGFVSYRDINPPKRKGPPWTEEVNMTPELRFKYQMKDRSPSEVLAADKARLEKMEQPALVNEQLSQLYLEMKLNGLPQDLALEEGITSSSSSGDENGPNGMAMKRNLNKTSRRKRDYSRLVMIYEEDAPVPPEPIVDPVPSTSGIAFCSK